MSSTREHEELATRARDRRVRPLLDAAFGFFVWMAHLLAVYITTALACGLGLAGPGRGVPLPGLLVVFTAVAAAVVAQHAFRRWRQHRAVPERRFLMSLTLGSDALAMLAIVWQLLAVLLVPVCR